VVPAWRHLSVDAMPLLPRRFERLRAVLNQRMGDLTVLLEQVDKPHNLSAILRSCDAVGVLEAHVACLPGRLPTFNSTAQGSQKWVPLHRHGSAAEAITSLRDRGFRLYGTHLGVDALDYRDCDFTGPTAFVLGAEKWGLGEAAAGLIDQAVVIPMRGMVQSLNVSVATATLLFEALRQRRAAGLLPQAGEGVEPERYGPLLFEWAYPQVAAWCRQQGRPYPALSSDGQILEELPRGVRLRC
jgi:tRNA (guanosine-2'-O-)-methyltransferase